MKYLGLFISLLGGMQNSIVTLIMSIFVHLQFTTIKSIIRYSGIV